MEYIGNGMKTEKSLILDIKNIILKIVCPNGKCIYNKKAIFDKFIEKIHENLKKLNQLGINVKSLNVDTTLFFFLEISKKFLICNGDERMTTQSIILLIFIQILNLFMDFQKLEHY